MSEIKAWQCDHCGKLIEKNRDVYRIMMVGEQWREGPPACDCQNIMKLGFCKGCAGRIVTALEGIAKRPTA